MVIDKKKVELKYLNNTQTIWLAPRWFDVVFRLLNA